MYVSKGGERLTVLTVGSVSSPKSHGKRLGGRELKARAFRKKCSGNRNEKGTGHSHDHD
ncbi:hypothetical protein U2A404220048 [Corynebacterium striatum]|nr:hypothetical protein U2A404220048 [Corynebacterium striatum]